MGVLACNRRECENIMCRRYSHKYGYICTECFDELVGSKKDIVSFMNTPKDDDFFSNIEVREKMLKEEFSEDE